MKCMKCGTEYTQMRSQQHTKHLKGLMVQNNFWFLDFLDYSLGMHGYSWQMRMGEFRLQSDQPQSH